MTTTATERPIRQTSRTCIAPFLYVRAVVYARPPALPGFGTPTEYVVAFEWLDTREPLDRPETHRISTGGDVDLAIVLALATEAGLVHEDARVVRDIDGASYVEASCKVMGKYLRSDLRALKGWTPAGRAMLERMIGR